MPVRIVEGQLPYTGGTGIEIDSNKVISLLLREENNLILVNDENEVYTDLQLQSGLTPNSDFPVGVTVGKVLQSDGWTQSGLILNWKTTSGDYARWIYANDGKIYFDNGTGTWKQVYYSSEVDILLQQLKNYVDLNFQPKLTAGAGITIDANNVISAQGAGTGDVSGPNSSVDGHLAVFDGTTGKAIKDSGVSLADYQEKLTAGTGIAIDSNNVISNSLPGAIVSATTPSNPTEGMVWYDTTNDVLKTYDGTNWNEVGSGTADVNTKTFFLTGTTGEANLATAQAAMEWYASGKNPLLMYNNKCYTMVNYYRNEQEASPYIFATSAEGETTSVLQLIVLDGTTTVTEIYESTTTNYSSATRTFLMGAGTGVHTKRVAQKVLDWYLLNNAENYNNKYNPIILSTDSSGNGQYTYHLTGVDTGVLIFTSLILTDGTSQAVERIIINYTGTSVTSLQRDSQTVGGGSDIVYATQAEYNALLPGAASDGKHYFIYSTSGGGGWQPGANTLAYRPLESDANDYNGTYNGTISGTALTFSKVGGATVNSAFFASTKMTTSFNTKASTISYWIYKPSSSSDPGINDWKGFVGDRAANNGNGMAMQAAELNKTTGFISIKYNSSSQVYTIGKFTDKRQHICVTSDGSNIVVYVNGTVVISTSGTRTPTTGLWLGTSAWDNLNSNYNLRGNISRVIVESVAWTEGEVQNYYDQTKGDYGIS